MLHYFGRDIEEFNSVTESLLEADLGIEKLVSQFVLEDFKSFHGFPVEQLLNE